MRPSSWGLLMGLLVAASCSHQQKVDEPAPVTGQVQRADPAFLNTDPASRRTCKGDADCDTGQLCLPDQLRCMSSYPAPRMLDVSFDITVDCKLVNVFFPFDSAELVEEAQRWLAYNARCIKSRKGARVLVYTYSDPRGDGAYNLELSRRRADAVKQKLQELGVGLPVEAFGRGEEHVAGKEQTERDFAWNRRASFSMQ